MPLKGLIIAMILEFYYKNLKGRIEKTAIIMPSHAEQSAIRRAICHVK
jgi:hypothetical protein